MKLGKETPTSVELNAATWLHWIDPRRQATAPCRPKACPMRLPRQGDSYLLMSEKTKSYADLTQKGKQQLHIAKMPAQ